MASWQITDNQFDFSITHSIAASKEIVYQVLADMESYPKFINDVISVKREGDLYKFVARAAILTIPATVKMMETPGRSIAFELVDGPVDVLTGSWLIEDDETPGQTKVILTIHVETSDRGQWLLRMTGKYVQNKTGKLIAAFSERVVELQRTGGVPVVLPERAKADGLIAWLTTWSARIFGKSDTKTPTQPVSATKPASTLFRDEARIQTLEALALTMLPTDDFDEGVKDMGIVSVVEMRTRYEVGREQLYATGLAAVDKIAQTKFSKSGFIDLTPSERTTLLDAVRQDKVNGNIWGEVKPSTFFGALWEDVIFLYCTHPDTWERIGFAGPSFDAGGHRDFDQLQEFVGQAN